MQCLYLTDSKEYKISAIPKFQWDYNYCLVEDSVTHIICKILVKKSEKFNTN